MNLLEKLKELSQQATPRPWDREGLYNVLRIARKSLDWELVNPTPDTLFPDEEDAVFIVLAINALPALIAVAEAAVEVADVARLREDDVLPKPEDDPKFWTARMQTAWNELDKHIAALEVEA